MQLIAFSYLSVFGPLLGLGHECCHLVNDTIGWLMQLTAASHHPGLSLFYGFDHE